MAGSQKKSPVFTGTQIIDSISAGGDNMFLKVEPDTHVDIIPLVSMDDLISINQHAIWLDAGNSPIFPCLKGTGEDCPGCQLGNKARYRGYLPVFTKDGGAKIFHFGISVARSLAELDAALSGGIAGKVLRVKRKGSGLKTEWHVMNTGSKKNTSKIEVPDVMDYIGPTTRSAILAVLMEAQISGLDEIVDEDENIGLLSSAEDVQPDTDDVEDIDIEDDADLAEDGDADWGDL